MEKKLSKNELIDEALLNNIAGGGETVTMEICRNSCEYGGSEICQASYTIDIPPPTT